jgi:hypothetical protein
MLMAQVAVRDTELFIRSKFSLTKKDRGFRSIAEARCETWSEETYKYNL